MPDKGFTFVSYAAGFSLAIAALVYVFAPRSMIDGIRSGRDRKYAVVGLLNQANDCFINSVLQVLVGLAALRVYLERETGRRDADGPVVYARLSPATNPATTPPTGSSRDAERELRSLQQGLVTLALRQMLDALDERLDGKRLISPQAFVSAFENALQRRVNRQQQDAQEFLQKIADRLKDEYHAGHRARTQASSPVELEANAAAMCLDGASAEKPSSSISIKDSSSAPLAPAASSSRPPAAAEAPEDGFPMEGTFETAIECQVCKYKSKPRKEDFCMLVLHVPQVSSTTLAACFDNVFKTEYIDDFKCDKCRLIHARVALALELTQLLSTRRRDAAVAALASLDRAISTDPEQPPAGVDLGDPDLAPRSRIARFTRLTKVPRILAIHLSRSIYDTGRPTHKNSAKVAFAESLQLGDILRSRSFRLSGLVTHCGSHNSGHYESFRRQQLPPPPLQQPPPPSLFRPSKSQPLSPSPDVDSSGMRWTGPPVTSSRKDAAEDRRRHRKSRRGPTDRWWRISDDKTQETRTNDVLGLQREVYLLFYELEAG